MAFSWPAWLVLVSAQTRLDQPWAANSPTAMAARFRGASHVRERDKVLLRGILSGGVWNGTLGSCPRENRFLPILLESWWGLSSSLGRSCPLWLPFERAQSSLYSQSGIEMTGPGVWNGMAGCLHCLDRWLILVGPLIMTILLNANWPTGVCPWILSCSPFRRLGFGTDIEPEELADVMPQNRNSWSDGRGDMDLVSWICVAGAGVFCWLAKLRMWVLSLGVIWIRRYPGRLFSGLRMRLEDRWNCAMRWNVGDHACSPSLFLDIRRSRKPQCYAASG